MPAFPAARLLLVLRWLRGLRYAGLFLIGVEFTDEFASGVPYATAFAVQETLGVGSAALNTWTFLVPEVLALLAEPYILLRSRSWGTRRSLQLGLLGMALALVLGAFAPTAEWLGIAVALYFPSSGLAFSVAQLLLVDSSDEAAESLTDWTLAGTLGDLGTPLVLWLLDAGGFSWRWTFALVGLTVAAFAALTPRFDDSPTVDDSPTIDGEDEEPSLREALRLIRGNRTLLWWLLAATLCSLLDELFASQIGIHLAHLLGQAESTQPVTLQLVTIGIGGALGLVVQRFLLRRYSGSTILAYTCVGTVLVFGAWLFALPDGSSVAWAALLGATIATHYPLAQAKAYDSLPGRANVVAAASQAFKGIDLMYPVLVGILSDTYSPALGLCALLLQPLGILLALFATRRHPAGSRHST